MKKFMLITLLSMSCTSYAWVETAPVQKEYSFKYELHKKSFNPRVKAASYEDAFHTAAQQCFDFYRDGKKVSEDKGLDIIDVCANPRS